MTTLGGTPPCVWSHMSLGLASFKRLGKPPLPPSLVSYALFQTLCYLVLSGLSSCSLEDIGRYSACMFVREAAQKRKRANTASSTEGVHQSPPTTPKSSKQKFQGKKNKSKHSDPQLEIYPEFDQEAQDDAEERGRQLASQTSASSKSKKQRPKIPKEANVPLPTQFKVKISNRCGPKSRDNCAREDGQRKAELWSRYASSFRIDKTLKELFVQRTNDKKALAKLAEYSRLEQPEIYHQQEVSKEPLPLEDQYKGRTEEDYIAAQKQGVKIHHDGIPVSYLQEYWANVQWLSVALCPHLLTKDI
ncbi:hypothetical protein V8D89_016254 [Ganoderma adspersum]